MEGGRIRFEGDCVYIRNWCWNAVVYKHCSPLEFIILKARPFYLSREFTLILFITVYNPPTANISNRNKALNHLQASEQQTARPDEFLNTARLLKVLLPKLQDETTYLTLGAQPARAYRLELRQKEVSQLVQRCRNNNLFLSVGKTKERFTASLTDHQWALLW